MRHDTCHHTYTPHCRSHPVHTDTLHSHPRRHNHPTAARQHLYSHRYRIPSANNYHAHPSQHTPYPNQHTPHANQHTPHANQHTPAPHLCHRIRRHPHNTLRTSTTHTDSATPIAHSPCSVQRNRAPISHISAIRVRRRNLVQRRTIPHPPLSHSVQRPRIFPIPPSSRQYRHYSRTSCRDSIGSILPPPSQHIAKHRRTFSIQRHYSHSATDSMNKPTSAHAHVLLGQVCFFAVRGRGPLAPSRVVRIRVRPVY